MDVTKLDRAELLLNTIDQAWTRMAKEMLAAEYLQLVGGDDTNPEALLTPEVLAYQRQRLLELRDFADRQERHD